MELYCPREYCPRHTAHPFTTVDGLAMHLQIAHDLPSVEAYQLASDVLQQRPQKVYHCDRLVDTGTCDFSWSTREGVWEHRALMHHERNPRQSKVRETVLMNQSSITPPSSPEEVASATEPLVEEPVKEKKPVKPRTILCEMDISCTQPRRHVHAIATRDGGNLQCQCCGSSEHCLDYKDVSVEHHPEEEEPMKTATKKRKHWTQTPEGRKKMSAAVKNSWKNGSRRPSQPDDEPKLIVDPRKPRKPRKVKHRKKAITSTAAISLHKLASSERPDMSPRHGGFGPTTVAWLNKEIETRESDLERLRKVRDELKELFR